MCKPVNTRWDKLLVTDVATFEEEHLMIQWKVSKHQNFDWNDEEWLGSMCLMSDGGKMHTMYDPVSTNIAH